MNDKIRCHWCGDDPQYRDYHDQEWGVPVYDGRALFEKLILDGFQAGLSWITILRRRDNFISAFDQFDPVKIAAYDENDVERLMNDTGIIRNRMKIVATIKNAKCYLEMENEKPGSFSDFIWSFTDSKVKQNKPKTMGDIPAQSPESVAMSKALKKRGFGFCGPTICYAFMQAVGIINDHIVSCHRYEKLK
ncbi:MAG: DNA-3-methyladenine glycosylase I [Alphaproteobacteria bacterium]|nr:DNA-3-methyladenine glycosylase I [Alphaproteobacteria bacterium]HPF45526.1 DNA-3-methyladenine glycosylase I [Emcibacteraceae bacterium]